MNFTGGSNGRRRGGDDVNITPVMNLFLILVPFLLLSTEFVRLAILELSLPSQNKTVSSQNTDPKDRVLIFLRVDESGFELKAPQMALPKIPKQGNRFDFSRLNSALQQIKSRYGGTEEITIQPIESIVYETIVDVMDACRDNGFPNISVSG